MLTNEAPLHALAVDGQQYQQQQQQQQQQQPSAVPHVRVVVDLTVPAASNKSILGFYGSFLALLLISCAFCIAGILGPFNEVQLWLWVDNDGTAPLVPPAESNASVSEGSSSNSGADHRVSSASLLSSSSLDQGRPPVWLSYAPYAPCTTFRSHACELTESLRPILTDTVSSSLLSVIPAVYTRMLEAVIDPLLTYGPWGCLVDETANTSRLRVPEYKDDNHTLADVDLMCTFTLNCTVGQLSPMVNLTTATLWSVNESDWHVWPEGTWPSSSISSSSTLASGSTEQGNMGSVNVSSSLIFSQADELTIAYDTAYRSCEDLLLVVCLGTSPVTSSGLEMEYLMAPDRQGLGVLYRCGEASSVNSSGLRHVTVCQGTQYEVDNMDASATANREPSVRFAVMTEVSTTYTETISAMGINGGSGVPLVGYTVSSAMLIASQACAGVILIVLVMVAYTLPVQRFRRKQMRTALELDVSVKVEQLMREVQQRSRRRRDHRATRRGQSDRHARGSATRQGNAAGTPITNNTGPQTASSPYGTGAYLPRTTDGAGTATELAQSSLPPSARAEARPAAQLPTPAQPAQSPSSANPAAAANSAETQALYSATSSQPPPPPPQLESVFAPESTSHPSRHSAQADNATGVPDLHTVPFDDVETASVATSIEDGTDDEGEEETGSDEASDGPGQLKHTKDSASLAAAPTSYAESPQDGEEQPRSTATLPSSSSVVVSRVADSDRTRAQATAADEPAFATEMTTQTAPNREAQHQQQPMSSVHSGHTHARQPEYEYSDADGNSYYNGYESEGSEEGEAAPGSHRSVILTSSATVVMTTIVRPPNRQRRLRRRSPKPAFEDNPRSVERIAMDARNIMLDLYRRQSSTMQVLITIMIVLSVFMLALVVISFSFVITSNTNYVMQLGDSYVPSVEAGRNSSAAAVGEGDINGNIERRFRSYYVYHAKAIFVALVATGIAMLALEHVMISLIRRYNII